ncbi:MAG: hypothetical protein SGI92_14045 [Bryobacteraceae bacterium]|nr:hypothetical protein [Bryobacteraceae bacterium]
MFSPDDLVTVYRSADSNAEDDATAVYKTLTDNGLTAAICDDSVRGVVSGSWEVRVRVDDARTAEALIAGASEFDDPAEESLRPDPSHDVDSVTILDAQGTTGEIEVMGIKSILDANDIPNVMIGASTLPNLSFQLQVPANDVERARQVISEAQAAGPAAAVEAERLSEEEA